MTFYQKTIYSLLCLIDFSIQILQVNTGFIIKLWNNISILLTYMINLLSTLVLTCCILIYDSFSTKDGIEFAVHRLL